MTMSRQETDEDPPAWLARLDPELVGGAQRQPYVAFSDPLAARRNFARATRLSRALRSSVTSEQGLRIVDRSFDALDDGRAVPVRVYRPLHLVPDAGRPDPVLVYFHGGAFLAGDLDTDHDRCVLLARDSDCVVVSVAYRRPPEHPFPAPVDDCFAAVAWVWTAAAELGVDPERIAVGGSSAGATLAAAVALMARDRGRPRLALQLLLYPALDDRLDTASMRAFPATAAWTVEDSRLMWRHYLGDAPAAADSYYAIPARCNNFAGVAPAYLMVPEVDALRDEAVDYAVRLLRDGVHVELHHVAGAFHGFDVALPEAQLSARLLGEHSAALRQAFRRPTAAAPR